MFFLIAAAAIPVFYLPALLYDGTTHFTIVDTWRFWIIHLWVQGFFELFVTVIVGIIFYELGLVERNTALQVSHLDAILLPGQRHRRDRSSLVLDGPVRNHHGAGSGVLRNGGGALNAVDT